MKKLIIITGLLIYMLLMVICFAANAQTTTVPQSATAPLIHIHSVKEFKGKKVVKDSTFRPDLSKMRAMRKHAQTDSSARKKFQHMKRRFAGAQGNPRMMGRMFHNADSVSVNLHTIIHGDSVSREMTRIVYFKPAFAAKTHKSADTVYQKTIRIHKGIKPSDIPDFGGTGMLQDMGQNGGGQANPNRLSISDLNVYPSPGTGSYTLSFTLPDHSPVDITITDMQGNTVWKEHAADFTGTYNKVIDITKEQKGIYILQISQNDKTKRQKLVKN